MHQSFDGLECKTCEAAPFMYCVSCEVQNLNARSVPMKGVYDFWKLAYEIMFYKP